MILKLFARVRVSRCHSSARFALSPNRSHVADLNCSPQLLQLMQPDHLFMRKTVVGAFDFHQLEEKFPEVIRVSLKWNSH